MLIRIITAIQNSDNAIGLDNNLLYRLPTDLQRFKEMTTESGHMIMGRKTFETFPKPLKDRIHYVITRNQDYIGDCTVAHSIKDAIVKAKDNNAKIVDIIGGGEIYRQVLELGICDRIELTRVKGKREANIFFPDPKEFGFHLVKAGKCKTDHATGTRFRFERWEPREPTENEERDIFCGKYE